MKVGTGYPGKVIISGVISSVRSTIFIFYYDILLLLLFSLVITYLYTISHDLSRPSFEKLKLTNLLKLVLP
jgi:hypothetical protein